MTSACLRTLVPTLIVHGNGICLISRLGWEAQPVHSLGSPASPRPPLTRNEPFWCRIIRLLAIAYDSNVLGLGPD